MTHADQRQPFGEQGTAAALHHDQLAVDLYRAAEDRIGQARALSDVAWHRAQLGQHQHAIICCQQALSLYHGTGERYTRANAWDTLGYAHRHLGEYPQAIACYRRALELFRES